MVLDVRCICKFDFLEKEICSTKYSLNFHEKSFFKSYCIFFVLTTTFNILYTKADRAQYNYTVNAIKNEDKAYIPFNTETSYYVSNDDNEMVFVFENENNINLNDLGISIWVKGKDIKNANIPNNGGIYELKDYENIKIFWIFLIHII